MRLAVSMWSYFHAWRAGRLDHASFVREAARIGADGVELLDYFAQGDRDAVRREVEPALAETGLPVGVYSVTNDFARPTEEERRAELGKIAVGIEEARRYGASVVRVYAGNVKEGITLDAAWPWMVESLAEAALLAAERGVTLALENHGRLVATSGQVNTLLLAVQERSETTILQANPDTGNFVLAGENSVQAVGHLASRAAMAHLKDFAVAPEAHLGFVYDAADGSRWVGCPLGEGSVELEACLTALQGVGFEGWLSLEIEGEADPFSTVPLSLVHARTLLQKIQPASR